MSPAVMMLGLRSRPGFFLALAALGLISAVVLGYVVERRRAAARAESRWTKKRQEWQARNRIAPAVTKETTAVIETDVIKVNQTLATLREELRGRGLKTGGQRENPLPVKSTDAFFDIATFAENLRHQAARLGVKFKPDERFGFSAYLHHGPEPGLIPSVFRQRVVMRYLTEALLAAGPRELIGFQRERPARSDATLTDGAAPPNRPRAETPATLGAPAADLFAIDPRISARVPGQIETVAFRLTFVGQTATLRAFLRALAEFELPVLVRAIEVEPLSSVETRASARKDDPRFAPVRSVALTADRAKPPEPVVSRSLSKFVVTIEYLERVSPEKKAAATPPIAPAA